MTFFDLSIILLGAVFTGFFLRRMGNSVPEQPLDRRASGIDARQG